jgi:hypothetical protein
MHVVFDDQGDRCCSSRSNVTRGLLDEKLLPSVLKSVRRRRKSYDNGGDQFMSGESASVRSRRLCRGWISRAVPPPDPLSDETGARTQDWDREI